MKIKKILAGSALLATLAFIPVGVSTSNSASAESSCRTLIHYSDTPGDSGHITDYVTCGGGTYKFRARAECFKDNHTGKGIWRSGSWRTANHRTSTAGCKAGTYLNNGGYNAWFDQHKYFVLWREGGRPE